MLKNTILTLRFRVVSPLYKVFSQQNRPFYVNYMVDFKHFIDEMHNFKGT